MVLRPTLIFLTLLTIFASVFGADFKRPPPITTDVGLEQEYKQILEDTEDFQKRHAEFMKKLEKMKQKMTSGEISDKDDIETNIAKYENQSKLFAEEQKGLQKRQQDIMEKLKQSNEKLLEERKDSLKQYARDYDIDLLKKRLIIYHDPMVYMKSVSDGGPLLTGYTVWDSAVLLAKYLERSCVNSTWLRGKKVIDIGAGTGYLGIVAACLGADVTITDLSPMLPLMEKNIDINSKELKGGGKIRAKALRWGDKKDIDYIPKQDILLMSNVMYDEEALESLISTMTALSKKGTLLLACQEKWTIDSDGTKMESNWGAFEFQASKHFNMSAISPDGLVPGVNSTKVWFSQGTFS